MAAIRSSRQNWSFREAAAAARLRETAADAAQVEAYIVEQAEVAQIAAAVLGVEVTILPTSHNQKVDYVISQVVACDASLGLSAA